MKKITEEEQCRTSRRAQKIIKVVSLLLFGTRPEVKPSLGFDPNSYLTLFLGKSDSEGEGQRTSGRDKRREKRLSLCLVGPRPRARPSVDFHPNSYLIQILKK